MFSSRYPRTGLRPPSLLSSTRPRKPNPWARMRRPWLFGLLVGGALMHLGGVLYLNTLRTTASSSSLDLSKTEEDCRRKCPHRDNKIVLFFEPRWRQAGISDRYWILSTMAHFAGYFCARLYVPKPVLLLDGQVHSGPLSSDLIWSDFFQIRFHDDDSLAVIEVEDQEDPTRFPGVEGLMDELTDQDYDRQIITWDTSGFSDDLEEVHSSTLGQLDVGGTGDSPTERFVWGIVPSMYTVEDEMKGFFEQLEKQGINNATQSPERMVEQGCPYVYEWGPSSYLQLKTIEKSVLEGIRQRYPAELYGSLHLRRGDSTGECDTTLAKMSHYVSCSFAGTQGVRIALLLFSDEKDECYRGAIKTMFDGLGNVAFVDLDEEVSRAIDHQVAMQPWLSKIQNNYHLFGIEKQVASQLDFKLVQRRTVACDECTKLSEMDAFKNHVSVPLENVASKTNLSSIALAHYDKCRTRSPHY